LFKNLKLFFPTIFVIFTFTSLTLFSYYWNVKNTDKERIKLALLEAKSNWNKDASLRKWATLHGGLYVKIDKRTPPNPYMSHIKERDIETTTGLKLTLMNPAYMMSQMVGEFEKFYGVKGKITGKVQLNPKNVPDEWQDKVLSMFEQNTTQEFYEYQIIDSKEYLRYMKPVYMTKGCIKCHGHLGFKDGDLRGGISISVPMKPYLDSAIKIKESIFTTHILVWLIGLIAIFISTRLFTKLLQDSETDPLTKIPNRRSYKKFITREIKSYKRVKKDIALLMIDVDYFKRYNDNYGHADGDIVLRSIAKAISTSLPRDTDFVARFGGEEFVVVLPNTDADGSLTVAQRIHDNVKKLNIDHSYSSVSNKLTISIGIAMFKESMETEFDIFNCADEALYLAKKNGRNRSEINITNHLCFPTKNPPAMPSGTTVE